jgi:hypothetical protein
MVVTFPSILEMKFRPWAAVTNSLSAPNVLMKVGLIGGTKQELELGCTGVRSFFEWLSKRVI